jgi:hypothetical protein
VAGILVAIGLPLLIEYQKRPLLRIECASDADRASPPPALRIVHIRVVNEPIKGVLGHWLLRNVATGCRVEIDMKTERGEQALPVFGGKWSSKPEPIQYLASGGTIQPAFDPARWPGGLVHDLPPNREGESVALAIKHDGDAKAYAFDPKRIYQDPIGLRDPAAQLSETEYEVTVTAQAGEISAVNCFTLRNEGTQHVGLRLDRRDM